MAYVKFEDISSEEQIARLHKALMQLMERFNEHGHASDGSVRIGVWNDMVELDTWPTGDDK